MRLAILVFAQLLLIVPARTADEQDPCSTPSTAGDVQFTLAPKDHGSVFRYGEIIPVTLSFSSTTKDRYSIDLRNYDRSGRLGSEVYCVEPKAADPLETYFKAAGFMGGGIGGEGPLTETPQIVEAEVNEWRTFKPGHYRVYVVSSRIWRPAEKRDSVPYSRVSERVASNAIEIEVSQPDPEWQQRALGSALSVLTGSGTAEEKKHAARVLRFLNTEESTRELARLFWGLNQQQATAGWDLMFGLFGSPHRQLAIDSLRAEVANPDHAITEDFLRTLVNLEISGDSKWDPPASLAGSPREAQTFWARRQTRMNELREAEVRAAAAALARKTPSARALTLNGLVMAAGADSTLGQTLLPALIAAWADLPRETQSELIQYRWPLIADPEMLPILRRMIADPRPASRSMEAMVRTEAVKHLYELDPEGGRAAIRKEVMDPKAEPSVELLKLLPKEDIAFAEGPAAERIQQRTAREFDYYLVDLYGDASLLQSIKTGYEAAAGLWGCGPQAAMLRYFLRVEQDYGASEAAAVLAARKSTGCYRTLLPDLGVELPRSRSWRSRRSTIPTRTCHRALSARCGCGERRTRKSRSGTTLRPSTKSGRTGKMNSGQPRIIAAPDPAR
jgi:hypothetical protein